MRGGDGAEVIYALRNNDTLAKKIATEFENAGQNVRKYYQRRLPSNPAKDYYYLLRNTPNNETLLVEYGFADSTGDDVEQLKNDWETLAEAVVKALASYIGVPYSVKGDNYYTVQKGDSLWSISKKYGISVNELKEANNLSTSLLSIGQKLVIPSKQSTDSTNVYTVQKGDSLYKIANEFNTTVNKLIETNNLSTTNLSIGQKLVIPENNINNSTYIVKKGDSLYKIANLFGTTVDELTKLNNLSTTNLSIGQKLMVPQDYNTYTVQKGDSLYEIAGKYNTSVSELKQLNNLNSNLLQIGQILKIPR